MTRTSGDLAARSRPPACRSACSWSAAATTPPDSWRSRPRARRSSGSMPKTRLRHRSARTCSSRPHLRRRPIARPSSQQAIPAGAVNVPLLDRDPRLRPDAAESGLRARDAGELSGGREAAHRLPGRRPLDARGADARDVRIHRRHQRQGRLRRRARSDGPHDRAGLGRIGTAGRDRGRARTRLRRSARARPTSTSDRPSFHAWERRLASVDTNRVSPAVRVGTRLARPRSGRRATQRDAVAAWSRRVMRRHRSRSSPPPPTTDYRAAPAIGSSSRARSRRRTPTNNIVRVRVFPGRDAGKRAASRRAP